MRRHGGGLRDMLCFEFQVEATLLCDLYFWETFERRGGVQAQGDEKRMDARLTCVALVEMNQDVDETLLEPATVFALQS